MNPNSANQVWSKWTFRVEPKKAPGPSFLQVRENCARFGRKAFGSASQMRVTQTRAFWLIEVRTEGAPVHDPAFVTYMYSNWRRFFRKAFGNDATVTCASKLEAGSRQDGTPADQLIIVPPLSIEQELLTWKH